MNNNQHLHMNKIRYFSYTFCMILYSNILYSQFEVIDPIQSPSISLDECKQRLMQSYDKETYNSFIRHGKTQQNMYYYLYVATNFSYSTTLLYYPASEVAYIYSHRLQQMDDLTLNVYFEILQEGHKHREPLCIENLAQLYGMVYQDTIMALDYYQQYLQMDVPQEKYQRRIEIFLKYLIDPILSDRGRIVRPKNGFKPETPDDWHYRIFWDGDVSAYNQLVTYARQSDNPFNFYECLYYSLIMAGKYAFEPAKADLREILGTMICENTPNDALAYKLLRLLE